MADVIIDSLRGGLDTFTPVSAMDKASCTVADNVEFFYSTLGERRPGTDTFYGLPAALVADPTFRAVASLTVHNPGPAAGQMVLVLIAQMSTTYATVWQLNTAGTWFPVTFATAGDAPLNDYAYDVYGQTLHGKFFLAYKSDVDRLHVLDSGASTIRRVGLPAMASLSGAADHGVGAYPAVPRYYRTRSVYRGGGGVVLVRSEPSPPTILVTPSGAAASIRVTRAALPGEYETDWELEASLDNGAYYKIATIAAATTIFDDTTLTTAYSSFLQSDPVNTYALIPSVQFLAALDDRLMVGGSWNTPADNSAVRWTPVGNDPSPGPDERFNIPSSPRVDLDAQEGGGLTAMAPVSEGTLDVFKLGAIYTLVRTGQLVGAYEAHCLTKARGALPHSVVAATDEAGHPANYFIDPSVGFMRIGGPGIQSVGLDVQSLFLQFTVGPTGACHGVYVAQKQQIHYWLGGIKQTRLTLQTNLVVSDAQGCGRGGWSISPTSQVVGQIGYAVCSAMFPSQAGFLNLTPVIGFQTTTLYQYGQVPSKTLQRVTPGVLTDAGVFFTARVRTRPFFLSTILNRHGVDNAALLAVAGSVMKVTAIRDFGKETLVLAADMAPVGSESHVLLRMDNFNFSELFALQIEFTDLEDGAPTAWQLFQFALRVSSEQTS